MKTKIDSKLFQKKLNLEQINQIYGSTGGCYEIQYTEAGCDTITTYYDDHGKKRRQTIELGC